MNIYSCKFVETEQFGDTDFCNVIIHIAAETRGKAKLQLLSEARDAGFEVEWTDPTSIKLIGKDVDLKAGVDYKCSWALKNLPGFKAIFECEKCYGEGAYRLINNQYIECEVCQGEGRVYKTYEEYRS